MTKDAANPALYRVQRVNSQLLDAVAGLTEEQASRRLAPTAPPIRFHLWHAARWSDFVQSRVPGMTAALQKRLGEGAQLWVSQGFARRWGMARLSLGGEGTGMGLSDDDAASLPLPGLGEVREYARDVFAATERAFAAVSRRQFDTPCIDWYGREITVGGALLNHVVHLNRHLGMIEALKGVLGMRGTATA